MFLMNQLGNSCEFLVCVIVITSLLTEIKPAYQTCNTIHILTCIIFICYVPVTPHTFILI